MCGVGKETGVVGTLGRHIAPEVEPVLVKEDGDPHLFGVQTFTINSVLCGF